MRLPVSEAENYIPADPARFEVPGSVGAAILSGFRAACELLEILSL